MRSVAIAALLIAVAIAVVTAVSFSSFGPSSETQVTPFESSTVIVTQDVPANCGSVLQTFRQGNFGMSVGITTNPKIGQNLCLNIVLVNDGPSTVSITGDTLLLNVTSSSGDVVFHDFFAVTQPNATLSPGQTYTGTTSWDTSQPSPSGSSYAVGTYNVSAKVIDEAGDTITTVTGQFNLASG